MDQKEKARKRIIIALITVWVLIVLAVIGFFVFTIGKVRVDVEFAPFAAQVKLDDTAITNHHSNYITPGEYHLTVEFDNFTTYEEDITVDENTKYLFGILDPANEEGEEYINNHADEIEFVQGIASIVAAEEGEKQRAEFPIIEKLPIRNPYYTIGYSISEGELNVTIESSIAYQGLATEKVLETLEADDYGKYDIDYYDIDNPFAGKFQSNSATDPVEFIKNGFSSIGLDFSVENGQQENEYYYAFLRYYIDDSIGVVYRIVLIENDNGWSLAADPYPLLTAKNTPNVPLEVINKVNQL